VLSHTSIGDKTRRAGADNNDVEFSSILRVAFLQAFHANDHTDIKATRIYERTVGVSQANVLGSLCAAWFPNPAQTIHPH
jgi:hypothetical protein